MRKDESYWLKKVQALEVKWADKARCSCPHKSWDEVISGDLVELYIWVRTKDRA
jgi:hypothetical protein